MRSQQRRIGPNHQHQVSSGVWTPAYMTTIGWWDADDAGTITATGSDVTQLDDKSGAGMHFTAPGGQELVTGSRSLNGRNGLYNDGNAYMAKSSFTIPASGDVMFVGVCEIDATDNSNDSLWSIEGGNDWQFAAGDSTFDGNLICSFADTLSPIGGPFAGPSVYCNVFEFGVGKSIYVDGSLVGSDSDYSTKMNLSGLLQLFANRAGNQIPEGVFYELVICEAVDDATRTRLETYYSRKWGISL